MKGCLTHPLNTLSPSPSPPTNHQPTKQTNNQRSNHYNTIDTVHKVDRTSAHGPYAVTQDGFPRNPMGRTGISGRGLLGRFGPNHAADPVVTRWKRNAQTHEVPSSQALLSSFLSRLLQLSVSELVCSSTPHIIDHRAPFCVTPD